MAFRSNSGLWLVLVASAGAPCAGLAQGTFAQRAASGLTQPVYVTHAPGDTGRLFICEKRGRIKILNLQTGVVNATLFLAINDTDSGGDGGLQSMAFHPDYANNGRFFVDVTVDNGGIGGSPFSVHIREYHVSAGDPDVADPTPIEIMRWIKPQHNHNGGWIGFNPRLAAGTPQYLYVSSGDGGTQGDPEDDAQTTENNRLGKMFRIDVESDDFPGDPENNFAIPADNPFVGVAGDDEIWSYGLRNPWRCSFDRATGDLYIADVGQNAREEVNRRPADSAGGENYAWNRREGFAPYQGGMSLPGDVDPIYDYAHDATPFGGDSIAGGYVYRGPLAELRGLYFFGDTISGNLWSFDPDDPFGTVTNINDQLVPDVGALGFVVSYGEDAIGNLYLVAYASGEIFRVTKPCVLIGDLDGDGDVDITDLSVQLAGFGAALGATYADGDLDGDGDVDLTDLSTLLGAFGQACAS